MANYYQKLIFLRIMMIILLIARILSILSHQLSLSLITLGRSSTPHLVSAPLYVDGLWDEC